MSCICGQGPFGRHAAACDDSPERIAAASTARREWAAGAEARADEREAERRLKRGLIFALRANGETCVAIADMLGISPQRVSEIDRTAQRRVARAWAGWEVSQRARARRHLAEVAWRGVEAL